MLHKIRRARAKRQGFTLAELLVSVGLLSAVTTAMMVIYSAAYTEFEHGSGTMTLNQRARETVDRVTQVLKTAVPTLNNNSEGFLHPNTSLDLGKEIYEADFLSSICFIPITSYGASWDCTDGSVANGRKIFESDQSLTAFVTRNPSIYRYRIAWNSDTDNFVRQGRNVPPRAVYFERLSLGKGGGTADSTSYAYQAGPNSASYFSERLPDTGIPINATANRARILGRDIHYFSLQRSSGSVVLLRLRIYNRDPDTNKTLDGATMRRIGVGSNRDSRRAGSNQTRLFSVDLVTNIHLPNMLH